MGNQILGSDKNIRLNDFPMTGMYQSFDWSPSFNAEDIFELGRDTKVATALELETQGSKDLLSIGGTAGILARMIAKRNVSTGAFEGYLFGQTQYSGTVDSATSTVITDAGITPAPIASALIGLTITLTSGVGAGQSRTITANTTTTITTLAWGVTPDNTTVYTIGGGNNGYTLTQTDLRECVFDIIEVEKTDQLHYDRAVILPRCFLTTLSGRADANGNATETMNFAGDFVIGAPSPYHVVRSIPATYTTSSTMTLADVAVTSSTHALMYVYIDERRIRQTASADAITASLGLAGVITISGYTIPTTARLHAIVWDNTSPTTTYPDVQTADRVNTNFHVKGWQADIYIAPADATNPQQSEKWLKVQSCDWNIDLRSEALRQISYNAAGTAVYCRLPTYPLDISMNASVYESDWADWKAILDPTIKTFGGTGTSPYTETYDFSPVSIRSSFAVVIQYRTKTGSLLQTWRFPDMRIDGYGARVQVQGRSEITWTFRGTQFSLVGVNL